MQFKEIVQMYFTVNWKKSIVLYQESVLKQNCSLTNNQSVMGQML